MTSAMPTTYTIGDYLLDRLAELGLTELFGVPGDFTLHFLDRVEAHDRIRWVGTANELNAGYAADGYARLRGIGALCTTFGVGELSAINALAGSMAESVPVVQIVGAPPREVQAAGRKVHHSLGDGDFRHFSRMAAEVTCAQANLDSATATWEIDRVLREVVFRSQPGHLVLPRDVALTPCYPPGEPLATHLVATTDGAQAAFEEALRRFLPGRSASVLVDLVVHRVGAMQRFRDFLDATRLPFATLAWGKTLVDESDENFLGIYAGAASAPGVRRAVEQAEALIAVGVEFTDNTTAGFSMTLDRSRTIEISRFEARVGEEVFTPISLERSIDVLERVLTELSTPATAHDPLPLARPAAGDGDGPLTQDELWSTLASHLDGQNVVLAEQGTSYFGMAGHRFPADSIFIGQPMWGSIGYTLPASLGAGLADRERRPVLLIGDGSAQMTIQELGTIVRERLPLVMVLVNNGGYTVERAIHGADEAYNDIASWRWEKALDFFGAEPQACLVRRVATRAELEAALVETMEHPEHLVLIEAVTGRDDIPQLLADVARALQG